MCYTVNSFLDIRVKSAFVGENTLKPSRPPIADTALDQEQIVQAALELLDESGLDGLSMRRLADKLGIKAASLYWHVRDKQHLMALLADAIVAPAQGPDPSLPWRPRLEAAAAEYRRILLSHRDAARVLASSGPPSGPHRLRLTEQYMAALLNAGFTPHDTAIVSFVMNDFITQFVIEEASFGSFEGESGAFDDAIDEWDRAIQSGQYPSIAALAPYLMSTRPDDRFQFGMQVLLDGLEKRLASTR